VFAGPTNTVGIAPRRSAERDAEAFDAEIRRLRRLGELGIVDAGRISLAEFGQEWLVEYAVPNLEPKTLRTYESLWDRHVLPHIGGVELRQLRPAVLDRYLAQLQRDGLSPASVKKVAGMLQGVLQRAVEWERIAQNPMRVAHKPRARRRIVIRPIAPAQVEQLRQYLLADGRLRGATLVSVLAYSGLRPGEALALTWNRVGERTIAVTGASSMGRLKGTKTGAERTVRLLSPLAHDLARVAARAGPPRSGRHCVPRRIAGRDPHRGPVEPLDPGHVQSRQARGGAAERAGIRPAPLVRLAADPRGPIDTRGRTAGRSLAADVPPRLRPPLRRVRPSQTGAGGGRDRRRPQKLVPLSYLSADARRQEAAHRAANPYSGISQSGNQRDTSSSKGSSFPTWDFRRSSRSLSRALSPGAGTNG
jgi:integrase